MSVAVAARIARRELRGSLKGLRIFLACLALGVAAIAAIGSVRAGIEAGLAREGAVLLGGDAMVELTYRRASAEERAALAAAGRLSEVLDFRSMAQALDGADRALTQVKAVDAAWPMLGAPVFDPPMPVAELFAGAEGRPGAALSPLLMARLGLSPGDRFRLGDTELVAMAALVSVPDAAAAGFALGPPMLVQTEALAASGLIREGTLFNALYRLDLPEGTDLAAAEARVMTALGAGGARWRDTRNGTPGLSEAVERLGRFLVLVGLAGLAVGGVGISAAVRAYLGEKTATIATLKVLGAARRTVFAVYALQIGVLTALGIALGLVLGAGLPLVFGPLLSAALPVPVALGLHPGPLMEAALYGVLAAALFSLGPLAATGAVRAAALYREATLGARLRPGRATLVATAALLAALVGVAVLFSGTPRITLWAAAGLLAVFTVLVLIGRAIRAVAARLASTRALQGRPALRMALAAVGGPGTEAASVVVSLGLGLSVLAAVGQIDTNLRGAIARELPAVAPSFFVVDIQPDQIDAFSQRVTGTEGVSRIDQAPMLRGIITTINGQPAEAVAGDHWVVQGDRGVTYSAELPDRTRLTAGRWWPEGYTGPPLISFSAEEAAEIGLQIGDRMGLNILGREIEGEVASFREVNFSTAGMGFTIAMNPSALAGAPHSWIATIYADEAAEAGLMRELGRRFGNITVISVREAIGQATVLMGRIAAAITYGALITLVTGAVVLVGAAAAGERARTYEAAVLKTLGAPRGWVLANFALRSGILGAAAAAVAVLAGGVAGWAVSRYVMDTAFVFDPVSALAIVVGGVVLTVVAGLAFAWRSLSASPSSVLRGRE